MGHFRAAAMNLGRVYLMQDRPESTIEVYQDLVEDGQADADTLLLLGHAMLMRDAPVGAETAYRQALLLRPRDTDTRMGLAKALLRQERFAEGLALVGEILEQEPLNRELWSLRVNALLSNGDVESAARAIEQARRLDRANPDMLATLGDLWLNADKPVDALEVYQEAFAGESPSVPRMLRAIAGFLMVNDPEGAERMVARTEAAMKQEKDGKPDNRVRLLRLRAELALQRGQTGAAMAFCKEVLEMDPLDGRALLNLAELQINEGSLHDAVLTCERAARIEGHEADALVRQAQVEVQRERYREAAALLEAAQTFKQQPHVARYLEQVRRMAELL